MYEGKIACTSIGKGALMNAHTAHAIEFVAIMVVMAIIVWKAF